MIQINPDLAKKLKKLDYLKKVLSESSDSPNYSLLPSLDTMLPHYKKQWDEFWKHEDMNFVLRNKLDKSDQRVFEVPQNFCLQAMFEKRSEDKGFPSMLFKEIPQKGSDKQIINLLSRWKINFSGKLVVSEMLWSINLILHTLCLPCAVDDAFQGLSAVQKKDMEAKDEGGPEAQFFSQIWQMIPKLEARSGDKKIPLFEQEDGGFVPITDEIIEHSESPQIRRQAELYYRALGRLFVNCLSMKSHVPDEVLPKLFRNGKKQRSID